MIEILKAWETKHEMVWQNSGAHFIYWDPDSGLTPRGYLAKAAFSARDQFLATGNPLPLVGEPGSGWVFVGVVSLFKTVPNSRK